LLTTDGFEIETELLIKATKLGLRIREVPSMELRRQHGKSSLHAFGDGFLILRTAVGKFVSEVLGSADTTNRVARARE
jgi:hypothetical protein